jgi:hypothetical protein
MENAKDPIDDPRKECEWRKQRGLMDNTEVERAKVDYYLFN